MEAGAREVNGDDMPDPTETPGPLNPAAEADYLSAAAGHLGTAESAYMVWSDPRATGQDRTDARATVTAAGRLAELNIRMAEACARYQNRQEYAQPQPYRHDPPAPKSEAEIADAIRAQVKADIAEHYAVTLRPGVDPEPPEDGALLTDDGEHFVFAIHPLTENLGTIHRWLIIEHYAQALKWRDNDAAGTGNFTPAYTWEGLDGRIGYADDAPLRRPTAAERTRFYGPEPDPQDELAQHADADPVPSPDPKVSAAVAAVRDIPRDFVAEGEVCGRCAADRLSVPAVGFNARGWLRCARCLALEAREEAPHRGGAAQWREG